MKTLKFTLNILLVPKLVRAKVHTACFPWFPNFFSIWESNWGRNSVSLCSVEEHLQELLKKKLICFNLTSTSPSGRQSISFTDDKGRTFLDSIPGILGVHYTYDNKGFLTQTRQGDRTTTFEYDSLGRLSEITDPINRSTQMEYDTIGRVTKQTLADGREISYSYDENGNLVGLTPPGKPAHFFGHTPVNLTEIYLPPEITDSTGITGYEYNLDRQLTKTIFSDSSDIIVVYDTSSCGCSGGSKPLKVITPTSETDFVYSKTSGQMAEVSVTRYWSASERAGHADTLRFSYDGSLPLSVEWAGAVSGRMDVSYNNDFKVISQRVNGAFEVLYNYDNEDMILGDAKPEKGEQ